MTALSTEGAAQPLRSPVAAAASAAEPSLAIQSPALGKGRPVATDRTVALRPGGGHQRSPGPPARVEHRHRKNRPHDLQGATILPRRSREVLEAIGIPSHGGFEEGHGVESSGGQRVDERYG